MISRQKILYLYLNDHEYNVLERNRIKCSLTRGNYVRSLIMNVQPKETPPVAFFEILKTLSQIRNDLDRIAAEIGHNGSADTSAYWDNVRWLQKCVGEMMEAMYG